jgi:sulfur relay (sulfurtransferase) complex TusBCD TusD component (DsrE family)
MKRYLLIESRDPFESADTGNFLNLAEGLAKDGNNVTLFLVQNGVLPARAGARSGSLAALAANGVEVLADDFSLAERGISANRLIAGVKSAPIDRVVDDLAGGSKAIWH